MNNIKKYLIGFIMGISLIVSIGYASHNYGSIGAMFNIRSDGVVLGLSGSSIIDGTITQNKLSNILSGKISTIPTKVTDLLDGGDYYTKTKIDKLLHDFVDYNAPCEKDMNLGKYRIKSGKIYKCVEQSVTYKGTFNRYSKNPVCETSDIKYADLHCGIGKFRADWNTTDSFVQLPSDYCWYVRSNGRAGSTQTLNELTNSYPDSDIYECVATGYKWYWKAM